MQRHERSVLRGDVSPVAEDVLVHSVFTERASRHRDVGVRDNSGFTSYSSLDRLSNGAARRLLESLKVRRRLPSAEDKLWTVAVDVEPDRSLLVALLAIVKLGLAYVPVDSQSATNRVKYILQVFIRRLIKLMHKTCRTTKTSNITQDYIPSQHSDISANCCTSNIIFCDI